MRCGGHVCRTRGYPDGMGVRRCVDCGEGVTGGPRFTLCDACRKSRRRASKASYDNKHRAVRGRCETCGVDVDSRARWCLDHRQAGRWATERARRQAAAVTRPCEGCGSPLAPSKHKWCDACAAHIRTEQQRARRPPTRSGKCRGCGTDMGYQRIWCLKCRPTPKRKRSSSGARTGHCVRCAVEVGPWSLYCAECIPIVRRERDRARYAEKQKRQPRTSNCRDCGQEFVYDGPGRVPFYCPVCRNIAQRRRGRIHHLRSKYNLSVHDYDGMLVAQNGVCAACKGDNDGKPLSVDHDHACCPGDSSCGRCVRGLLCGSCNRALGFLDDDDRRISRAITYLRRWE